MTETESAATLEATVSGGSGNTGATAMTSTAGTGASAVESEWSSGENWDGSDDQRY